MDEYGNIDRYITSTKIDEAWTVLSLVHSYLYLFIAGCIACALVMWMAFLLDLFPSWLSTIYGIMVLPTNTVAYSVLCCLYMNGGNVCEYVYAWPKHIFIFTHTQNDFQMHVQILWYHTKDAITSYFHSLRTVLSGGIHLFLHIH